MQKCSKFAGLGTVLTTICAAALLDVGTAKAAQITEADLLNGVLPSTTMSVSSSSAYGRQSGSADYVLNLTDANGIQFDMQKMEAENCGVDVTSASECYFNTYAIRVARSGQYWNVNRAPKKWAIYGMTSDANAEWELVSSEEDQTGWRFADNGGDSSYGQENTPGETRYYHFNCNHKKFKKYRFLFLESNGDGRYINVTRIVLYGPGTPATGATADTFSDCADRKSVV